MAKFPPRRPRAAAAPEAEPPADAAAQRRATETPGETRLNDALAVEVERRFNDLRRELLDDRAKTLDWWLAAMAIVLTLFGVVAVVAGYLGFKRFREIEAEARGNVDRAGEHAEKARELVENIAEKRDEATSLVQEMTAETAAAEPDKADEAAQSAQADPSASLIDQAIAAAIRLQQRRDIEIERAIEKWRAVANVAGGIDDDLGARAWFSVGYLLQKDKPNDLESAIAAYDEAIRLKPDYAKAYNNRGVAKDDFGRYEDAIADYDEAIRLNPDYAEAYSNRGNAKRDLGRHEDAIADHDEAVRLKPDLPEAYNSRGVANVALGRKDGARRDFETALALARAAGDETAADKARDNLARIFGGGDP